MWLCYLLQQTTCSRSVLSERVGGDDKIGFNVYHTHTYAFSLSHVLSTAGSHQVEVDTWVRGQVGTVRPLTFLCLDHLPALLPLLFSFTPLFFFLSVSARLCDSPHVKTDLVAGRIHGLCVPAALIAVLWRLSLTHWVTYLPNISLYISCVCSCSKLLVHISVFICCITALKIGWKHWWMQDFAQTCM